MDFLGGSVMEEKRKEKKEKLERKEERRRARPIVEDDNFQESMGIITSRGSIRGRKL